MKKTKKNAKEKQLLDSVAHKIFLKTIDNDPRTMNISHMAKIIDVSGARLWFYVNGKSRWTADAWIKVMAKLRGRDEIGKLINDYLPGGEPPDAA